jgi:multicomponent Na+:H+ antiporter subunit D
MTPVHHLIAALVLPLATAIAQTLLPSRGMARRGLGLAGAALIFANGLALISIAGSSGPISVVIGGWPSTIGIKLGADMLSALMIMITGFIGFAGLLHAPASIPDDDEARGFQPLYQLLLFGVSGAFLTRDLFNLFVWFEVMLLSSFVLIAMGGGKERLEGAVKYVALNLVASFLFLTAAGLLYANLGTLDFNDLAAKVRESGEARAGVLTAGSLLFLSFSTKAGLFPLYAWLPASYHTPPHTISAVFAGLLTKVGVYALFRVFGQVFASERAFFMPVLGLLSLLTMIAGVLGAASQFHSRRILSFHIISQIGYMTIALVAGTTAALAAGIFYIIHHIIVKTNLFFAAAAIARHGGGEDLHRTGGLYRAAPWLGVLFLVPALSLGGIPPLSGFWAKFALLSELLALRDWIGATVAIAVGILTLFSMTKIWSEAFWKERPAETDATGPLGFAHLAPMVLLAVATVWLSLFPSGLFELADTAARQILSPAAAP